ncbi:MAG: metalloregulator ArsR/SmtB family transcription factor [Actinomycetota bacterium]|jgi:DNA-binding transcriptional ArsR family regulator|nr:helix-turn-helix transcriptional regulator [Rubrobacter sp.]MDQ3507015.1 metalloregulator ArsR/SmtB family transcription factor [Actinomycetota bacterium]
MQKSVDRLDPMSGLEVGRDSEELCLLARFFNGFANSTRLSILLLLSQRGEMKVGELVEELDAPQPRVSDHLRCLSWCGYVKARREGRNAYYSISDERVLDMMEVGERMMRDNLEHLEACDPIGKRTE